MLRAQSSAYRQMTQADDDVLDGSDDDAAVPFDAPAPLNSLRLRRSGAGVDGDDSGDSGHASPYQAAQQWQDPDDFGDSQNSDGAAQVAIAAATDGDDGTGMDIDEGADDGTGGDNGGGVDGASSTAAPTGAVRAGWRSAGYSWIRAPPSMPK